jgi:hypothetical protein
VSLRFGSPYTSSEGASANSGGRIAFSAARPSEGLASIFGGFTRVSRLTLFLFRFLQQISPKPKQNDFENFSFRPSKID